MSETESEAMDGEDDAFTSSTNGTESRMTTDNETDTEEEYLQFFNSPFTGEREIPIDSF